MSEELFGSICWAGTYNNYPAIILSYYGGAKFWIFKNEWKCVLEINAPFHSCTIGRDIIEQKLNINNDKLKDDNYILKGNLI